MFPPIISLRHEPGIKFLYGLGVDVPAYNFFKEWARHKISSWPGVDVPPIISLRRGPGIIFFVAWGTCFGL